MPSVKHLIAQSRASGTCVSLVTGQRQEPVSPFAIDAFDAQPLKLAPGWYRRATTSHSYPLLDTRLSPSEIGVQAYDLPGRYGRA